MYPPVIQFATRTDDIVRQLMLLDDRKPALPFPRRPRRQRRRVVFRARRAAHAA